MIWGISLIRSDLGLWHFEKKDTVKKDNARIWCWTGAESRKEGKDD